MQRRRELLPNVSIPPISLGGANLGGGDDQEAEAILRVAAQSGIELVDTSSAYGRSEEIIGASSHRLLVTTKFGNPCELNGQTHDYSVGHCAACAFRSQSMLQGQPIAALQLHSPPEVPSPLENAELRELLGSLKASGAIGGWGASVHSVRGGQIALAAGADMLQVPFSILQQEHAPLLAQCCVERRGVLAQSVLCQGWLTETGVAAARLLLSAPHRLPARVDANGRLIDLSGLLHSVLQVEAIAHRFGMRSISELALRFAVHAPGCTSALVQVRTAGQLRQLLRNLNLSPLPPECLAAVVAICADLRPDGSAVHGANVRWSWGAPTPRACIEGVVRAGYPGGSVGIFGGALQATAAADTCAEEAAATHEGDGGVPPQEAPRSDAPLPAGRPPPNGGPSHEMRRRFVADGYIKLESAFPPELAAALVEGMHIEKLPNGDWRPLGRYHAYRTGPDYFRCDASVLLEPGALRGDAPELEAIHGAVEQLLDAQLYGGDGSLSAGFVRAISTSETPETILETSVVSHAANPERGGGSGTSAAGGAGAWSPPDGMSPEATCTPLGLLNGYHIDDGHLRRPTFTLESYLQSPWLVVLVCLTDVLPAGGPTVLVPGSHHMMARLLACSPGGLNTQRIYSLCAGHDALGSRPTVAALGRVGDVYLCHPLLLHSASMSCIPQAKCMLNLVHPFGQARVAQKQGPLSAVVLPIKEAVARRPPLPLLPLLWVLHLLTIAAGHAHRTLRGRVREPRWLGRGVWVLSCLFYWLSGGGFRLLELLTHVCASRGGGGLLLPEGSRRRGLLGGGGTCSESIGRLAPVRVGIGTVMATVSAALRTWRALRGVSSGPTRATAVSVQHDTAPLLGAESL
jgi:aryl-alcohol dehydrogenase-like predicted oxidoreductase